MQQNDIKIGDLVCLKDDKDIIVGVGLVLDKKDDSTEIVDMIDDLRTGAERLAELDEIPEFLLFKPIYLVLWQGENISPTDKPVWMFSTELKLVKKRG